MRRVNSWTLVLLVAAGVAVIYGVLAFYRMRADPTLAELLTRLPNKKGYTLHVDLAAIRAAGLGELLEGSPVVEEPDYVRFVTESGFDWKRDLAAVTATNIDGAWFVFARGQFDLEKLRNFVITRNGTCKNGVCDVAAATPGRRVSFFPITPRVLAIATSKEENGVYSVLRKGVRQWPGEVPGSPVWVALDGQVFAGDPALPSGGRLFGKVLAETERATFSVSAGGSGLTLKMRANCATAERAANVKSQLELVTKEFKGYFARVGQATSPGDLSGLLLAGEFGVTGSEVTGQWPLHADLVKKLAGGTL